MVANEACNQHRVVEMDCAPEAGWEVDPVIISAVDRIRDSCIYVFTLLHSLGRVLRILEYGVESKRKMVMDILLSSAATSEVK